MQKIGILLVMTKAQPVLRADGSETNFSPHSAALEPAAEIRQIEEAINRSKHRDSFDIVTKAAASFEDLRQALLDHSPQIVHFSGRGYNPNGLALEDENSSTQLISAEVLSELFSLFKQHLRCVISSTSYSKEQAQHILKHISHVVGMEGPVSSMAAIAFSSGFYDAIGAVRSYKDAFKFGCVAIKLKEPLNSPIPFFLSNSKPTFDNNQTDNVSKSMMIEQTSEKKLTRLSAIKAKGLQQRLAALSEDHQAISNQISCSNSEVEKTKLTRYKGFIEKEIAELESELNDLINV